MAAALRQKSPEAAEDCGFRANPGTDSGITTAFFTNASAWGWSSARSPVRLSLAPWACLWDCPISPLGAVPSPDAVQRFGTEYVPEYPKAVTTLEKDADVLLTFFDFPAEHWKHLRTSYVIECRSRRCGCGSA